MPEPDYFIKTGDTGSPFVTTLENSAGTAVDIQGASVLFKMAPLSGGTLTLVGTCTVLQVGAGTVDGSRGQVSFNWPTGGVATADWYRGEFEVTYMSGTIQSFPNSGYALISVEEDL